MTDLFFCWIWVGGAFADYGRRVGFWNRAFWPIHLGARLGDLVFPTRDA